MRNDWNDFGLRIRKWEKSKLTRIKWLDQWLEKL